MLRIHFKNNYSDNNVVQKYITDALNSEGYLLENTDLLNPVLLVRNTPYNGQHHMLDVNYLHLPDFDRYYYITGAVIEHGELIRYTCKIDVLMTYRGAILASTQKVVRQQNLINALMHNEDLPMLYDKYFEFNNASATHFNFTGTQNSAYVFNTL